MAACCLRSHYNAQEEEILKAIELSPNYAEARRWYSDSLHGQGQFEEALELLLRSIELNPEFGNNYDLMAIFQEQSGHLGKAQRWLNGVRKRNPGEAYKPYRECRGFLDLGDVLSADKCARQLSEAHPEKVITDWIWPMLHRYRGELKAATATLEPALERVPGFRPGVRWLEGFRAFSSG